MVGLIDPPRPEAVGERGWRFLGDEFVLLDPDTGMIAVIAANIYVIFFNVSWGPVMWVMLGEMFPNQIRGVGLAVSGLAQFPDAVLRSLRITL